MSSIVRRFFWTEHPLLLRTVQEMFDFRAEADAEANKLATSIGAVKAHWKGTKLGGFSFGRDVPLVGYRQVATEPVPIYMPVANVGTGRRILQEMEKLVIPDYNTVLAHHGIFTYNWFQVSDTKIEHPQVFFSMNHGKVIRIVVVIPYFAVGSPEALVPNRSPQSIADSDPPEGFIEWTHAEAKEYLEKALETRQ